MPVKRNPRRVALIPEVFEIAFGSYWLRHSIWRRGYYPASCLEVNHVESVSQSAGADSQGRNFLPKVGGTTSPPLPSLSLPFTPPFIPFPFRSRALNRVKGPRECCKLPQQGPGRSPSCTCISAQFQLKRWPLVALKSGGYANPSYPPKITPMLTAFIFISVVAVQIQ